MVSNSGVDLCWGPDKDSTTAEFNATPQVNRTMELYSRVSHYISEFQWVTGKTFMSSFETAVIGCVLYVVSLIVIQRLMRNREPIRLETLNLIHNIFLCIASFVMLAGLGKDRH